MDNSDQTRHLGVHHMTATKCEEWKKGKQILHTIWYLSESTSAHVPATSKKIVLQKASPLYHTCQPKLLKIGWWQDAIVVSKNQWTRFSRPVTALAYLLIWFVVGAQCRFITWGRWCWCRRCSVYLSSTKSVKFARRACEKVEMCV